MNVEKACKSDDIPTKIIKLNKSIFSKFITSNFNHCLQVGEFPCKLKDADITPVYKKEDKCDKSNYRPVSILSNISKIYEKLMYNQLQPYFDSILSDNQCGFRKGFSTQHCVAAMIEKMKAAKDNGNQFGALLTDLSKAFDCIDHKLLLSQLHAYGTTDPALKMIFSYLSGRNMRTKVNDSFSPKLPLLYGVPQGSILGPLFFNIYLADLFLFFNQIEIASYADDTTPYTCAEDLDTVILNLEEIASTLLDWFQYNHLKANAEKCHLILSTKNELSAKIGNSVIKNSKCEKLLGILVDCDLNFDLQLKAVLAKVSKKLNALRRVATYMTIEKRRIVMKAFIQSQFSYCPLVWMMHSRSFNNRINCLHERALRTVYSDYHTDFDNLLKLDNL